MPAIIQPTMMPTFQATSLDEYLKPLQEYKNAYDAIEKSYNTLEDSTAVLEKLKADYPESEAYKRYAEYQQNLSNAAESLASVGLTPNSRKALHRMRDRYTKEMMPIIAGYAKIADAKTRFNNLKPGEVMSYDPYAMSIDQFIGENPEFRPYNLEQITAAAKDAANAHSSREDLWFANDDMIRQLQNNYITAIGHEKGFLNADPKTIATIKNAQDVVEKLFHDPNGVHSNDPLIQNIVAQVGSLDLTKMSSDTKSQVLSAIIQGTITGLTGQLNYQTLGSGASGSGSGSTPAINAVKYFELSDVGVDINPELRKVIENEHDVVEDLYDPGMFSSRVRKFNKLYEQTSPKPKQTSGQIYINGKYNPSALNENEAELIAINNWNKQRDAALQQATLTEINKLREKYNLPALTSVDEINDKTRRELDYAIDKENKSGIYAKKLATLNTQDASTILSFLRNRIGPNNEFSDNAGGVMYITNKKDKITDDSNDIAMARKIINSPDTKITFDFSKSTDNGNKGDVILTNNTLSDLNVHIARRELFNAYQMVDVKNLKIAIRNQIKEMDTTNLSENDQAFIDSLNDFVSTNSVTSMENLFETLGQIQNISLDRDDMQEFKYNVFNALLDKFGEGIRSRANLQLVSKSNTSSNEQPTNKNKE